jgi:hypothetical protein
MPTIIGSFMKPVFEEKVSALPEPQPAGDP